MMCNMAAVISWNMLIVINGKSKIKAGLKMDTLLILSLDIMKLIMKSSSKIDSICCLSVMNRCLWLINRPQPQSIPIGINYSTQRTKPTGALGYLPGSMVSYRVSQTCSWFFIFIFAELPKTWFRDVYCNPDCWKEFQNPEY